MRRFLGAAALCGILMAGAARAEAEKAAAFTGLIDLNAASAEELDRLPGVGEKATQRILEYRAKHPFKRIEELVKVKGFGWKRFQKLKAHLAVKQ